MNEIGTMNQGAIIVAHIAMNVVFMDEDSLYTKTITGVITEEEYNKIKELYDEKA